MYLLGCQGKIQFKTKGEALTYNRRIKKNKVKMYAYPCRYLFEGTQHFHLTHMPRGQFKKNKYLKPLLQNFSREGRR